MKKSDEILKIVCKYYNIEPILLFSKTRKADIVYPRQVFFYLVRQFTKLPYHEIGKYRTLTGTTPNHDTIIHSCRKIENLYFVDKKVEDEINELKELILLNLIPDSDNVEIENIRLRIALKNANKTLTGLSFGELDENTNELIKMFLSLDDERKEKALLQISTSLKIQNNMKHQKLRTK